MVALEEMCSAVSASAQRRAHEQSIFSPWCNYITAEASSERKLGRDSRLVGGRSNAFFGES